jgi:hypothetical protein
MEETSRRRPLQALETTGSRHIRFGGDEAVRIKIATTLCVLFALAPLASPKGTRTPTLSLVASCNASDTCTLSASGLGASTSYVLNVTDSCGGTVISTSVNSSSSGNVSLVFYGVGESAGCNATGWTFSLFTGGKRSSLVASTTAVDPD